MKMLQNRLNNPFRAALATFNIMIFDDFVFLSARKADLKKGFQQLVVVVVLVVVVCTRIKKCF
jgi:hypothetical protein